MADGGVVEAALITAAVSAGTAIYTSEAAAKNAPKKPQVPEAPAKEADTGSFASAQQQAQTAAQTAGGTIKSDPNENRRQIGTAVKPPSTLLGS